MASDIKTLTIELTDDDANEVEWVTGNGHWVHWQDCNVTIFVKDSNGKKGQRDEVPREKWGVEGTIRH